MAKKKKSYSRKSKKIPVAATAGAIATGLMMVAEPAPGYGRSALDYAKMGNFGDAGVILGKQAVNYKVYIPVVGGAIGSMAASKFKINRYLSGIPLFKI